MGLSVQQANFWVVETYLWLRRPTGVAAPRQNDPSSMHDPGHVSFSLCFHTSS